MSGSRLRFNKTAGSVDFGQIGFRFTVQGFQCRIDTLLRARAIGYIISVGDSVAESIPHSPDQTWPKLVEMVLEADA